MISSNLPLPQFRRQSADGLSLTFVALWLTGDVFNVIGSIIQGVLPTTTALAFWYMFCDIILLLQCIIYHRESTQVDPKHLNPATPLLEASNPWDDFEPNSSSGREPRNKMALISSWRSFFFNCTIVLSVCAAGILAWYVSERHAPHDPAAGKPAIVFHPVGQFFGYLCAIFYLGSRVPQIFLNYRRKSCEGISFLFFMFACLGNACFVISILALDVSPRYLLVNLPWLAGSFGTLCQDAIIFTQFWVYNGIDEAVEIEDGDYEDIDSLSTYQAI